MNYVLIIYEPYVYHIQVIFDEIIYIYIEYDEFNSDKFNGWIHNVYNNQSPITRDIMNLINFLCNRIETISLKTL
jgi:hypothetical protein